MSVSLNSQPSTLNFLGKVSGATPTCSLQRFNVSTLYALTLRNSIKSTSISGLLAPAFDLSASGCA